MEIECELVKQVKILKSYFRRDTHVTINVLVQLITESEPEVNYLYAELLFQKHSYKEISKLVEVYMS